LGCYFFGEFMLKAIGYIGYGYVGKACEYLFKDNSESVIVDPKYSTKTIKELVLIDPDMIFVAINAPTMQDGSVDTSLIESIFDELKSLGYNNPVVLKSTIPPLQCDALKHKGLRYVYSPEFLTENNWKHDIVNPDSIIFAGTKPDCLAVELMYRFNSSMVNSTKAIYMDYKSAALAKYAMNSFLAMKVVFMNQLHELSLDLGIDYNDIAYPMSRDTRVGNSHMNVPGIDGKYGFGGHCLPKDIMAMQTFDKNGRMSLVQETVESNICLRLK
jgi:nucleotide sugar dehydrogenase